MDQIDALTDQIATYNSVAKGKKLVNKEVQTVVGAAYFNQL